MKLPIAIQSACQPVFDALPLEQAMCRLTGSNPVHTALVETALSDPALTNRPDLAAGLWLYVDDLDRSHAVSQSLTDDTGSFWHGIMHRREGDFSNSHYWFRRAARHPLTAGEPHIDPHNLVDAVASGDADNADLIEKQRSEWAALFEWCANRG